MQAGRPAASRRRAEGGSRGRARSCRPATCGRILPTVRRVLVVFETAWDRRQLAACEPRWRRDRVGLPRAGRRGLPRRPRPAGVRRARGARRVGPHRRRLQLERFPRRAARRRDRDAARAARAAARAVLRAAHKYYSRRRAARGRSRGGAEASRAARPARDARAPLAFPFFVKPVKGSFSVLARRDRGRRRSSAPSSRRRRCASSRPATCRSSTGSRRRYPEFERRRCCFMAEELLRGELVTVEGYVCAGAVELLGIVDATLHAQASFARFDYPSRCRVRCRSAWLRSRAGWSRRWGSRRRSGTSRWSTTRPRDRVAIVEVNPRICGQFADLYQKVDGTNGYEIALALARASRRSSRTEAGATRPAASFPLRVFEPTRGRAAPAPADDRGRGARVRRRPWCGASVEAGDELARLREARTARACATRSINLGGASRGELAARFAAMHARLGFRLRPL